MRLQDSVSAPIDRPPRVAVRDVLALFGFEWDTPGFARLGERYRFHHAGFDLFAFPGNARLLVFDIDRFVARLVARHRGRIAGVVSHEEQFGALAAALVAEQLGLPGTTPEAIIRLQHKHAMRELLEVVAPEANVEFFPLDYAYGQTPPEGLRYPLFVKPMKAAFSVLARRVESRAELAALTRFGPLETWIIRRLVKPFDDVAHRRVPLRIGAHRMLAEQPVDAPQYNLDGWVHRGRAQMLGVVDAHMYPGTQAFLRFAYPSRLPVSVQRRAFDIARRLLNAAGFTHGFFNMEFFHDRATDELKVIELNPRLASQMADLYQRVDGIEVFEMATALACGDDPMAVPRRPSRGGAAASFVFRTFGDQVPPPPPDAARQQWLAAKHPDALLLTFPKRAPSRARDMKWLGSHRHAVLHLHGDDEAHLRRRYEQACRRFGWLAPW